MAAGEPPGRWCGRGAEALGLAGEVDAQDMTALYERFIDRRDDAFRQPVRWDDEDVARLRHTGRRYRSEDEIYRASLAAEPDAGSERRAELRVEAGTKARKNVAFLDAPISVQKSITVLHAAFEGPEVRARAAAEDTRRALAAASGGSSAGAAAASGAPAFGARVTAASEAPDAVHWLIAELEAVAAEAEAGLTGSDDLSSGSRAARWRTTMRSLAI